MTNTNRKAIDTLKQCVYKDKPFIVLGLGLHVCNAKMHELTTLLADAMADDDFRYCAELAFGITGPNKDLSGVKQLNQ